MRIVAFGGGHGLAASLRALRLLKAKLDLDLTAVVTVGDDGGSSGRLRADRGGLPPGDLRQALAALADPDDPVGMHAADLLQYRFPGEDPLGGHAVGNLLLTGLMELTDNPVLALERARDLVRAVGRVLPMSPHPVSLEATVRGDDPTQPDRISTVRGQHALAVTPGSVTDVRLIPAEPTVCAEAVDAVHSADWLVFGPGSWFTSVIPHLMVPELRDALVRTPARTAVVLNLAPQPGETEGFSPHKHLEVLAGHAPALTVDVVLADARAAGTGNLADLEKAAAVLGARLVMADVAAADGTPRHDPRLLAGMYAQIFTGAQGGSDGAWR